MPNEVWKDIKGYEGLYQVSSLGRVRSLDRSFFNKDISNTPYLRGQVGRVINGVIRVPTKKNNGYLQLSLWKDDKQRTFTIHRLVAEAFLPNPKNLPYVNHKNEVKDDNRVENLEWCTHLYNCHYGDFANKVSKGLRNLPSRSKPVIQLSLDGKFLAIYPSANEAERKTSISQASISRCCNKEFKTAGKFKWVYEKEYNV